MSRRFTVTVELVPADRRTGVLSGVIYAVVQKWDDDTWAVHLPETPEQKAMEVVDFGQLVAEREGAEWVPPGAWIPGVVDTFVDVRPSKNGLVRAGVAA